jgi:hypothetical protein
VRAYRSWRFVHRSFLPTPRVEWHRKISPAWSRRSVRKQSGSRTPPRKPPPTQSRIISRLDFAISSFFWQAGVKHWRGSPLLAAINSESGRRPVASQLLQSTRTSLPLRYFALIFRMPERTQKPIDPAPWGPKQGDGGGPRSPDISRPDTKDLLKKMRKVDPNQSKRYRQRTGQ